jgi:16S rRNA (uracil1498-N3)-methyltransferase
MAHLYLHPGLDEAHTRSGARVQVTGDEARHALQVSRVRVGEQLALSDGRGTIVHGTVVEAAGGTLAIEVERAEHVEEPRPALWLAQALAKGDRDELAIQAATELGVAGVIPWAAERSVSRWEGAKVAKGEERWRSIVREASKQAIRGRVPEVASLSSTKQLTAIDGAVIVLDPTGQTPLTAFDTAGAERVTLVVGPEGGISPRELDLFAESGAVIARLGPEVLRTSTAGPAALAVLNARLGRW